jgi:hypothetical protein
MKASDAIREIQEAVLAAEKAGNKDLSIVNLNAYLASVLATADEREGAVPAITEAQAAHQLEVWKAQLSSRTALGTEMMKFTMEAGQTALRSAIVINGGAAVTVLAFAGNLITKGQLQPGGLLLTHIGGALLWFMMGAGAAGVSSGFRYLAQLVHELRFDPSKSKRWAYAGHGTNFISIALGVASFALFFVGGIASYHAVVSPTVDSLGSSAVVAPGIAASSPVAQGK